MSGRENCPDCGDETRGALGDPCCVHEAFRRVEEAEERFRRMERDSARRLAIFIAASRGMLR